jgi:NodT family efflux transporter outer membrane factor (OMF) lipoprotein
MKPSHHLRSRLATVAAAVLLAGCSMMPTYERPPAPVAADWPQPGAAVGPVASELPWQQFFTDERLRQLIAIALNNNRDLRVAILNIEQARAQYDIRRADQVPNVGLAIGGSRATAGSGGSGGSGGTGSAYTAGLALSTWEIDFFGRVASLSESALAQFLATEEGRKTAQTSLVASVANSWLTLVADQELLDLTRRTLATREESLRLARLRFDQGIASELEWRQAQSLAESSRAALALLTRQQAVDLNALALLLGQPVPADLTGAATTASVTLPDLPAGTPSEVLTRRPDVRQAEQQLLAANANIGAARAAFFPRITLTAGVGTASGELNGLFAGGSWGWTVAPQLLLPIFDAGRNRAGLASATAGRDIAIAQYERAIQSAFREVSDALAGRATFGDQLQALILVAEAENARYRLSELRFRSGIASYLELLDSQRALFTAETSVVQTRLQRLQNQVLLYRALGGGWTEGAAG